MEPATGEYASLQIAPAERPARIAHRGGNTRTALRTALAGRVDWLETDVWLERGRIVARHDPRLWRLPLSYHHRRVRLLPLRPLTLDLLLRAVSRTGTRLLVDLKGVDRGLPAALAAALREPALRDSVAVCTQNWRPLDELHGRDPAVPLVFSLGRPEHIPAYLGRLAAGTAPPVISIDHRLLTEERIREFQGLGVQMIAWTVNDPVRARELERWGVDGITSDSAAVLEQLGRAAP